MQIWVGNEANTYTEAELGLGEWSEEEWGVRGAVEMSVAQGFALFLGKEGLTWERYQVSWPRLVQRADLYRHMRISNGWGTQCSERNNSSPNTFSTALHRQAAKIRDCPLSDHGGSVSFQA